MRRQLILVLLAAAVVLGTSMEVQAAEGAGVIHVTMDHGEGKAEDAAVTLYYVGYPGEQGYILTDGFGGGIIRYEDEQSPVLAQWLAEAEEKTGMEQYLNRKGSTVFKNLPQGLYLLVQSETARGYATASPFLIPIPFEGQWEVTALPKMGLLGVESPKTGQHPAPIIGAMVMVLSGVGLMACVEKIRRK